VADVSKDVADVAICIKAYADNAGTSIGAVENLKAVPLCKKCSAYFLGQNGRCERV